jgi:hypothetical protein
VISKTTNVGITVSLYDFPANAQAGGATGRLYTDSGTLIGIASGLDFSTTPFTTTASVATEYEAFKATAALAPTDGFVDTDRPRSASWITRSWPARWTRPVPRW